MIDALSFIHLVMFRSERSNMMLTVLVAEEGACLIKATIIVPISHLLLTSHLMTLVFDFVDDIFSGHNYHFSIELFCILAKYEYLLLPRRRPPLLNKLYAAGCRRPMGRIRK
jgi:hypothetical protein